LVLQALISFFLRDFPGGNDRADQQFRSDAAPGVQESAQTATQHQPTHNGELKQRRIVIVGYFFVLSIEPGRVDIRDLFSSMTLMLRTLSFCR